MRNIRLMFALLLVGAMFGCSKPVDESPQPISAAINNTAPEARNAPAMETDESPGALAARMQGQGGAASKMRGR